MKTTTPPWTLDQIEDAIQVPRETWRARCHEISLAMVHSDLYPPMTARVARGWAACVPGQHSWVIESLDAYDRTARILDPTLWSYEGAEPYLWVGTYEDDVHSPHGGGSIWDYGMPSSSGEDLPIVLTPKEPLSLRAQRWLDMLGPLDRRGWGEVAHAPVQGWPAKEIITAMYQTKAVRALVPLDIVGMATNLNPENLYLKEG